MRSSGRVSGCGTCTGAVRLHQRLSWTDHWDHPEENWVGATAVAGRCATAVGDLGHPGCVGTRAQAGVHRTEQWSWGTGSGSSSLCAANRTPQVRLAEAAGSEALRGVCCREFI